MLGIEHLRTTSYHPQANGIIERWHRTLKAAIMCHDTIHWADELPTILLGLRSTYKDDIKCTPCEMVYGTTLQLPGQFFDNRGESQVTNEFIKSFRETMNTIKPKQTAHHGKHPIFVHKALSDCTHVFVRNDAVRLSLQPPYNGPFEIIERKDKYFKIRVNQKTVNVSIDRLKPAFLPINESTNQSITPPTTKNSTKQNNKANSNESSPAHSKESNQNSSSPSNKPNDNTVASKSTTVTTRAGRHVRFPDRLGFS